MEHGKCAYCGVRNESVTTHSGVLECDKCWYWRKLDGPAAEHWKRVTAEFLSNVDGYDFMTFSGKVEGFDSEKFAKMIKLAVEWRYGVDKAMALEMNRRGRK